jgi:hypothetical protein
MVWEVLGPVEQHVAIATARTRRCMNEHARQALTSHQGKNGILSTCSTHTLGLPPTLSFVGVSKLDEGLHHDFQEAAWTQQVFYSTYQRQHGKLCTPPCPLESRAGGSVKNSPDWRRGPDGPTFENHGIHCANLRTLIGKLFVTKPDKRWQGTGMHLSTILI